MPVSPIVYPGVAGLEVHGACLEAARRGEFERSPPRGPLPVGAAVLLTLLLAIAALLTLT